jgi:SAM-dependent methyltransferase
MSINYLSVTELSGDDVTQEQVDRHCNRYYWAGTYCKGKDVLEVACGTGQGLGYLAKLAKSFCAGDYTDDLLKIAEAHYGNRIPLQQFDAQDMPYADNSMDVVILFEAIYYLPSAEKFVGECRRILRKGGKLLIATANKDLYDFHPSPYSYKYYGVVELNELLSNYGFSVECFGNTPITDVSLRQKALRPVKKMAVKLGLIPRTMNGKKVLKKLVFGGLVKMPYEIEENLVPYVEPTRLSLSEPDKRHKVIYCAATLQDK